MSSTAKWPHQNNHTKRPGPCDGGPEKSFLVGEWEGVVVLRLQASFSSLQSHTLKALTVLLPAGQVKTKIKTPSWAPDCSGVSIWEIRAPFSILTIFRKKYAQEATYENLPKLSPVAKRCGSMFCRRWDSLQNRQRFLKSAAEPVEVSEKCCRKGVCLLFLKFGFIFQ